MLALATALFALWAAPALAQSGSDDVSEEVIVYDDSFARWDDTRWLVQAEFLFPIGVTLAKNRNEGFLTYALQVRSVVHCNKEHQLSKKKVEVGCTIEDVGMLATSMRRWKTPRQQAIVQSTLDEIDAKLTDMKIQIQTDVKGGITNVDLDGLSTRNERERVVMETLRQIVSRLVAGFHLRIPNQAQRSGEWVEYSSALMSLPALSASRGSSTLKHVVSRHGEHQIVQTVGKGSSTIFLPINFVDVPWADPAGKMADAQAGQESGGREASLGDDLTEQDDGLRDMQITVTQESNIDATWDMHARGVAVFDRETGVMSERVWVVHGVPTASAGQGTQLPPYRNAGRLVLLGKTERADVGPTKQVAPPGWTVNGLDPWISIESLPE